MNDIYVTLTGNVAAPPRQHTFPDGSRVTSLKVATTSRYFDRENQQWRNGDTTYFGVRCFRGLADNVAQSVHLGQPVVVQGRLRIREFTHEGERRFMPEVEANSLGHDLRWGLGSFAKPQRGGATPTLGREERSELDRETFDWAMGGAAPDEASASGALALVKAAGGDGEVTETEGGAASEGAAGSEPGTTGRGPEGEAPETSEETEDEMVSWELGMGNPGGGKPEKPGAGKPGTTSRETTRRRAAGKETGAGEGLAGGKPGEKERRADRAAKDDTPWPTEEDVAA
ncbi:single-stranded DNA-binding protein [Streptosporangium lutulentum]|uniref:Single-stranded DNA-binding protein n=1 Tax=Streptosporangium lutulentum TaxID=1461250 RepID=A0ABT9QTT6_9ACTN|nr:single-stranded DNA-binding protein [Streptosporangium lutulentum]MDP9850096.1 single-strand DNA-binding protein [Streptosporangium lutulentum]